MASQEPKSLVSRLILTSLVSLYAASAATSPPALLDSDNIKQQDDIAKENWAYSVGIQAYVFALPLAIFDREYRLRTNPDTLARVRQLCPCAPINEMGHMHKLATASDKLPYTPNNDTIYSGALFDVSDEPVILTIPDEFKRYWSVQFTDQYLENFAYLSSRASKGKGGHYLLAGPNWQGTTPPNTQLIRVKENIFSAALRIAVNQEINGDLAKARELQEQVHTTSLSHWGKNFSVVKPTISKRPYKKYTGELPYFSKMVDLLDYTTQNYRHAAALAQFKTVGIQQGKKLDTKNMDPAFLRGLKRAEADGHQIMRWKVKYRGTPYPTGWNNLHEGTYGYNYINRAEGALEGLIVHDKEEAVYFSTYEDINGSLLNGSDHYVLHFEPHEIPQFVENGFWSLTMYGPDFQLVDNPINRYALSNRSSGLRYNKNGSLTIRIQHEAPEGHESNWLPTPRNGLFRINYRIYRPSEEASSPSTMHNFLPGIKKVN